MGSGEIGCGDDAFGFEQFVEAVGVGGEGEDRAGAGGVGCGIVEVEEGEHLAADGLVGCPEDEIVAPLAGLDDVGEGQEVGANLFGVHGVPPSPYHSRKVSGFIDLHVVYFAKVFQTNGLSVKVFQIKDLPPK